MSKEREGFFDKPRNVALMQRVFYALCAGLLLLDLVIHRHTAHPLEGFWGFYAGYGFVACVALVLAAKVLRRLLMRSSDYYERD